MKLTVDWKVNQGLLNLDISSLQDTCTFRLVYLKGKAVGSCSLDRRI